MNRRDAVVTLFALSAGCAPLCSLAQHKTKQWRVGLFFSGSRLTGGMNERAFLAGLKDLGYDVGRNLIVDTRYAEGDPARWPAIADELIALKPDVLLVSSTGNVIVTKSKTTAIPIVMGSVGDPVADGIVKSFAQPGGNVTGPSMQSVELGAKQIELMAEVLPRVRRVALLADLSQIRSQKERYEQAANAAAAAKNLVLDVYRTGSPEDIRRALQNLEAHRTDALLIGLSPRFNALRPEICRSAAKIRLPVVGFSAEWPEDGALMSYSPSWVESYRRAAYYVDRILKGAKPGDLPIEQPRKFELVVNTKVAKALGISIPRSILVRADRVIE